MRASGLAVSARIDRQHIVEQVSNSGERQMGRPFCLQHFEFRSRMGRENRVQRAEGGRTRGVGALASAPTCTAQCGVPKCGTKPQPVIAFDSSRSITFGAWATGLKILRQLLTDQLLLQTLEHRLSFLQSQAHVLDSLAGAINCLNRDAEWQRAGGFDQYLDSEFHREPPGRNQQPVCAMPD